MKKHAKQFVKFIIIGGIGLLVNMSVTYVGVQYFGLWYLWSFFLAALVGWTVIFIGNALFTFPEHERNSYIKKYITFIIGYSVMFSVNASIVFFLTSILSIYYLVSIIIGTIITTLLTFTFNKKVIFR